MYRLLYSKIYNLARMKNLTDLSEMKDIQIKILDNNEILSWIKKWNIYPYQFIEAYNAVKVKTISKIEEYLQEKGLINTSIHEEASATV